jgi:hypothetical protein
MHQKDRIALFARIGMVMVFLALIRTIIEPLIQYQEYHVLQGLAVGALVSAISCLGMTILSFFSLNRWILFVSVATIVCLVVLKFSLGLQ